MMNQGHKRFSEGVRLEGKIIIMIIIIIVIFDNVMMKLIIIFVHSICIEIRSTYCMYVIKKKITLILQRM